MTSSTQHRPVAPTWSRRGPATPRPRLTVVGQAWTTGRAAASPAAPGLDDLVTVVICTLGRNPLLTTAVASVLAQRHANLELLVVDNDPAAGRARLGLDNLDDPRLRVVDCPVRGLSSARNQGLAQACGGLVAFTDDDAEADPGWLQHLVAAFAEDPEVACVTGRVVPAEVSSSAQRLFEEFGAFDKGRHRLLWSLPRRARTARVRATPGDGGALFPLSAGVYGSGNNMAFRTGYLRTLGGFDPSLGAGSLTRGGEDIDAFLRVVLAGDLLVYEPGAEVRHRARADMGELRSQLFGYGTGMCAVIVKQLLSSPRGAARVLLRVPAGLQRLLSPGSSKNEHKSEAYPKSLTAIELLGYASGPFLYLAARTTLSGLARRAGRH